MLNMNLTLAALSIHISGGTHGEHVEVDETLVGGRTRGKRRGVHDKVLVACAIEVRQRKQVTSFNPDFPLALVARLIKSLKM